ncbi:hypothetical protein [Sporisorium scitamineum]|uniref:Uncharacterized protein n=1 Tax=Sporisorium scitamineum TaxID=49012 RepID=A0A0F7SA79_9BASI|nr:hypothetical protein [Sporisorium scitamineum]
MSIARIVPHLALTLLMPSSSSFNCQPNSHEVHMGFMPMPMPPLATTGGPHC